MTIHSEHPFADPDPDPARRFRARIGGAVTLWTAGEGPGRAGLTVTSMMVALGPTPVALALIDPDSDVLAALRTTGRAIIQPLAWGDRQLAEAFAGTAPAPGGPFKQAAFVATPYGPRLATATTYAEVSLADEREIGWSVEVTATLGVVRISADAGASTPLLHRRGRFTTLPG